MVGDPIRFAPGTCVVAADPALRSGPHPIAAFFEYFSGIEFSRLDGAFPLPPAATNADPCLLYFDVQFTRAGFRYEMIKLHGRSKRRDSA